MAKQWKIYEKNVEDYKNHVRKLSFVSQKIFNKNFLAAHKIKQIVDA